MNKDDLVKDLKVKMVRIHQNKEINFSNFDQKDKNNYKFYKENYNY